LSVTTCVLVIPPPVAVIVIFAVEAPQLVPLVNVRTLPPFPGAATAAWLSAAVTPEGNPDSENAIAELNPPSGIFSVRKRQSLYG